MEPTELSSDLSNPQTSGVEFRSHQKVIKGGIGPCPPPYILDFLLAIRAFRRAGSKSDSGGFWGTLESPMCI